MRKILFLASWLTIVGQSTATYPMAGIWLYLKNSAYKAWNYRSTITNPIFNSSKTVLKWGLQHKKQSVFTSGAIASALGLAHHFYSTNQTQPRNTFLAHEKKKIKTAQALEYFTFKTIHWNPHNTNIAAYDKQGEMAGQIHIGYYERYIDIAALHVLPKYRRQGLGSALMMQMLHELRNNKQKEIRIVVQPAAGSLSLDELIKFYGRFGAEVMQKGSNSASMVIP